MTYYEKVHNRLIFLPTSCDIITILKNQEIFKYSYKHLLSFYRDASSMKSNSLVKEEFPKVIEAKGFNI